MIFSEGGSIQKQLHIILNAEPCPYALYILIGEIEQTVVARQTLLKYLAVIPKVLSVNP